MKILIILNSEQKEFVEKVSKGVSDPRAKNGNFSKGIRYIIDEYKRMMEKNEN